MPNPSRIVYLYLVDLVSFQDELRALFRKHEQEWDERYVWD
jgi:hypothetical protein